MKKLKVFKLHSLFAFLLMSLCMLFNNETSAQSASCDNWTVIATEGQRLNMSGTQMIRYGANGRFVEMTVPAGTRCVNTVFGDPAPGLHKLCSVCEEARSSCWKVVAAEHQRLNFSGTQVVRYGTSESFVEKTVSGSARCNNITFGGDPTPGVRKQCSVCQ